MEPRYVTLTNTMAAIGMVQSGGLRQGHLGEGEEAVAPIDLQGGDCVTFVALGESGVRDIDVIVRDAADRELARDNTVDAQAAAQFCPRETASYRVAVRMTRGSGDFLATAWRGGMSAGPRPGGGGSGDGGPSVAHGGPGTCEEPWPLAPSETRSGDTSSGDSAMTGSCIMGTAPEHVYSFVVTEYSIVTASVDADFDCALYIVGTCGNTTSELACNDDTGATTHSEISAALEPGTYYLVVDGWGRGVGTYSVSYAARPARSMAEVCRDAPVLTAGQPVSGTTTGEINAFQGSCAGQGTDRVYALDVASPSRVRVQLDSTHDGTLYMRSECANPSSELACNDDTGSVRRSVIATTVQPGRYYVFADGWSGSGDYTLRAEVGPISGSSAPGDTCASATPYQAGQPSRIDTIGFADDLAGSCGGQGAPDYVYRLDVRSRSRLQASFSHQTEHAAVLYLQRTCGDPRSELACAAADGSGSIDQTLAPGTYFLVVDGADANSFGVTDVTIALSDIAALEQSCRDAPLIRPGVQVHGDTTGATDRFQASCAGGARSPDLMYRLQIRRRSSVRIASEQTGWDGAIYLRRDCLDMNSELGCNDDAGDNRHSMIEATLEPGTYYVFVDGWASGNQGPFTLDVDARPL